MTGLREMFADVATEPGPPSRLNADELFAAGRGRRRRRRVAMAGAVTGALVAAVLGVAGVRGAAQAERPPLRPAEPPATTGPVGTGLAQWAGAADANHLYQGFMPCTALRPEPVGCDKLKLRVSASSDGGRTWGPLGAPIAYADLAVLGPARLAAVRSESVMVSTDGGGTWTTARVGPDVPAAPPGAPVLCLDLGVSTPCVLSIVDAVAGTYAALAKQPPIEPVPGASAAPTSATRDGDRLWVAGLSGDGQPAVAHSVDAGRGWTVRTLPSCKIRCSAPELVAGPGGVVYALVDAPGADRRWVFRWRGSGAWAAVDGVDAVPFAAGEPQSWGYVAGDGRLVLADWVTGGAKDVDHLRYWAAASVAGGDFRVVSPEGLPDGAYPVRRTGDGLYYALSFSEQTLYRSTDGWHWSATGSR